MNLVSAFSPSFNDKITSESIISQSNQGESAGSNAFNSQGLFDVSQFRFLAKENNPEHSISTTDKAPVVENENVAWDIKSARGGGNSTPVPPSGSGLLIGHLSDGSLYLLIVR